MARRHFLQCTLSPLLLPISWAYAFIMGVRRKLYQKKVLKSFEPRVKTICVGNISWGGTGKSPVVDYLLKKSAEFQKESIVLTRGYGKKFESYPVVLNQEELLKRNVAKGEDFPDEALMLLAKHPDINILIDPVRARAAKLVFPVSQKGVEEHKDEEKFFSADTLIMDDGYQHLALNRHIDLLLWDVDDLREQNPFGFLWEQEKNRGRVIPLGTWREGAGGLDRASAFLLKCPKKQWFGLSGSVKNSMEIQAENNTGGQEKNCIKNQTDISVKEKSRKLLEKYQKPFFIFEIVIEKLSPIFKDRNIAEIQGNKIKNYFKGRDYALVCGVGKPEQVRESLVSYIDTEPSESYFFEDHHEFSKEKDKLLEILHNMPIICTEKDAVKIQRLTELQDAPYNIYGIQCHAQFYDSLFYNAPISSHPITTFSVNADKENLQEVLAENKSDFDCWLLERGIL